MMRNIISLSALAIVALSYTACDLERSIDLNLPEFESQLVVECYLEPGKPYRAVLSETIGYFGAPLGASLPTVSGATIVITHAGQRDTLIEGLYFDPFTQQIFNYGNNAIVPADFDNDFTLEVIDSLGRGLTATTRMLRPIAVDSVQSLPFNAFGGNALSILTYFTDDPAATNYYYLTQHRTRVSGDSLKVNFAIGDDLINRAETNQIVIGGPPSYEPNDTVILTLYHISESYSTFIESTAAAEANNGNPFAQPGSIRSNVQGGLGIFTGLNYARDTFYLVQ